MLATGGSPWKQTPACLSYASSLATTRYRPFTPSIDYSIDQLVRRPGFAVEDPIVVVSIPMSSTTRITNILDSEIYSECIGEPDEIGSAVQRHASHCGERAIPRPNDRGHGRGLGGCSCRQQVPQWSNDSLVSNVASTIPYLIQLTLPGKSTLPCSASFAMFWETRNSRKDRWCRVSSWENTQQSCDHGHDHTA
jgi:hypothetical protein